MQIRQFTSGHDVDIFGALEAAANLVLEFIPYARVLHEEICRAAEERCGSLRASNNEDTSITGKLFLGHSSFIIVAGNLCLMVSELRPQSNEQAMGIGG